MVIWSQICSHNFSFTQLSEEKRKNTACVEMCSPPAQLSCLWNLTSNCKKPPLMSCQWHSSGPNPKQSWLLLRTTAANTPSQPTRTGQGLFIPALGLLEDQKGSTGQVSREGREHNYKSMERKKTGHYQSCAVFLFSTSYAFDFLLLCPTFLSRYQYHKY